MNKNRTMSVLRLFATLGAFMTVVKARKAELRGAGILATTVMICCSWWKNNAMTQAAEQGQQMIDSIKTAQRYDNTADMVNPTVMELGIEENNEDVDSKTNEDVDSKGE